MISDTRMHFAFIIARAISDGAVFQGDKSSVGGYRPAVFDSERRFMVAPFTAGNEQFFGCSYYAALAWIDIEGTAQAAKELDRHGI